MYQILVCDDDKEIVEAIRIYLSGEGYQVIAAYNGREALEAVHKEVPHLAILDIMMPEMDGLRLTGKLREEGYAFPILFLSAKTEDTDKILGLNIGADDYITKPFRPLELIARVKSALRRYTTFGSLPDEQTEQCSTIGGIKINDVTAFLHQVMHLFKSNPNFWPSRPSGALVSQDVADKDDSRFV